LFICYDFAPTDDAKFSLYDGTLLQGAVFARRLRSLWCHQTLPPGPGGLVVLLLTTWTWQPRRSRSMTRNAVVKFCVLETTRYHQRSQL